MKKRHFYRIVLLFGFLYIICGCSCKQGVFKEDASLMLVELDQMKRQIKQENGDELISDKHEKFGNTCSRSEELYNLEKFKKSYKVGIKAKEQGNIILEKCKDIGDSTLELRFPANASSIENRYFVTHYDYNSSVFLIFSEKGIISQSKIRGAVSDIYSLNNVIQILLRPRHYVTSIESDAAGLRINTGRGGWFFPVATCMLAGPDLGQKLNRGDRFHWINFLRFFPYIRNIPLIMEAYGASKGKVGVDSGYAKHYFEKVGLDKDIEISRNYSIRIVLDE